MLFPEPLHLFRQTIGIRSREIMETVDPELLEHFASFSADAAHLAQMPLSCSFCIAQPAPAAERALATVGRKRRRIGSIEINTQLAQGISQLLTQTS